MKFFYAFLFVLIASLVNVQAQADSLLQAADAMQPSRAQFDTYATAFGQLYHPQPKKALAIAHTCLRLAQTLPIKEREGFLYHAMASLFHNIGEEDSANYYFGKCMEVATRTDDAALKARYYNSQGNIAYDAGRLTEAVSFYQHAYEIHLQREDKKAIAGVQLNISNIYNAQKKYKLSEKCLLEALKIAEEIDLTDIKLLCYTNLGNTYRELDDNAQSLGYYLKALQLARAEKDAYMQANLHISIAECYNLRKSYDKALENLDKAQAFLQEADDKEMTETWELARANTYIGLKRYEEANKLLQPALQSEFIAHKIYAYQSLAEMAQKQHKRKQAKQYLQEAERREAELAAQQVETQTNQTNNTPK